MSDNQPQILPPNTVQATVLPGIPYDVQNWIRACKPQRDWMDQIPQKFIYRCIPMVAANTMGWEILNPVDVTLVWDGGELNTNVQATSKEPHPFAAASHFGGGIATWYLPFLFRTSPDLGLVVTGPANHERDDATPLDAFVRTDWLPFPFTMNWRLLKRDTPVTFKSGEPICRIYPFPIELLEETRLEITALESDPAFLKEVEAWGAQRQQNVQKQQADAKEWMETGERPTGEGVWNSQYVRAKNSMADKAFQPKQTIFKCADPEDQR